jgi:hypothetical protein
MKNYQPIQISYLTNADLQNELDNADSFQILGDALKVANKNKQNDLCKAFLNLVNSSCTLRGTNWRDIAKLILIEKMFGELK